MAVRRIVTLHVTHSCAQELEPWELSHSRRAGKQGGPGQGAARMPCLAAGLSVGYDTFSHTLTSDFLSFALLVVLELPHEVGSNATYKCVDCVHLPLRWPGGNTRIR